MTSQQDDQQLVARWQQRQSQLRARLEALGVAQGHRDVQWEAGRVTWRALSGDEATAAMRALCSFMVTDGVLLMAWANADPGQAVIEPVEGVPDVVEPCEEGEAWLWAMRLADAASAEYLLPVSTPSYLIFLGLWALHDPMADFSAEPGTPLALVLDTLDSLVGMLRSQPKDGSVLRQQFLNQADSLHQSSHYLTEAGANALLLEHTCDMIAELGTAFAGRRFGLLPSPLPPPGELAEIEARLRDLRREWIRRG